MKIDINTYFCSSLRFIVFSLIICTFLFSENSNEVKIKLWKSEGNYSLENEYSINFIIRDGEIIDIEFPKDIWLALIKENETPIPFIEPNKKHPFKADREHIHHYLLNNFTFLKTTLIIQSIIIVPFLINFYSKKTIIVIVTTLIVYSLVIYRFSKKKLN